MVHGKCIPRRGRPNWLQRRVLRRRYHSRLRRVPASTIAPASSEHSGFSRTRVRSVYTTPRNLDEHFGTGPDLLPVRILKKCTRILAFPVALLARKLLCDSRWPLCWRTHWIHPLHKRKSRADAKNCRGVHLTTQLSKVVERVIGVCLFFLQNATTYRPEPIRVFQRTKLP